MAKEFCLNSMMAIAMVSAWWNLNTRIDPESSACADEAKPPRRPDCLFDRERAGRRHRGDDFGQHRSITYARQEAPIGVSASDGPERTSAIRSDKKHAIAGRVGG